MSVSLHKWFCYGCGTRKADAKPGLPCPASCGHLATRSWP